MGVTGARDAVSSAAPELVRRVKEVSDIPVGVGLGVGTVVGANRDGGAVGADGASVTTADGEATGGCDSAADGRGGSDGRLNEPDGITTPLQAASTRTTTRPARVGRMARRGPGPFLTGPTGMAPP